MKSTVIVSLAVRPRCVYRDISTRWEACNPPEVLVSSLCGLVKPLLQPQLLFVRPLVKNALFQ